ncbi:Helix-turn-helix domain [Clostridium sp. ASBs410]|nr:Helix-turn-helix domain [Clostridium sp. ASBs410]
MYEKYLALLNQTGETTYKVAKATGISQTTFSYWKSGRSKPKADKLKILADHFGVTIDFFYE